MVSLIGYSQSPIINKDRRDRALTVWEPLCSNIPMGRASGSPNRPARFHRLGSLVPRFRRLQFRTLVLPVVTDEIDNQGQQTEGRQIEENLMKTIGKRKYEDIEKLVTPRTLQKCESNTLLLSMKVDNNNNEGTR